MHGLAPAHVLAGPGSCVLPAHVARRCREAWCGVHAAPAKPAPAAQVLALQLLKILLENSGPIFRNSDRFVAAIKQYLCLSLLKNVTVPSAQVRTVRCCLAVA